jgi:peptide/nickel transport system permease protein
MIKKIKNKNEISIEAEKGKSYFQLVWRNFKKNKIAILGGIIILILAILSIFAPFFSPYDPTEAHYDRVYQPPQRIYFFDENGRFSLTPFTYNLKLDIDPVTYSRRYKEDTSKKYYIKLFVKGWNYNIFGITCNLHLFGVEKGGVIHLFGTDLYGRDLLSRILFGGRISLSIAFLGAFLTIILGSIIGVISGYYGGVIDLIIQRIIEVLQSFPQLPLWMALSAAVPKEWSSLDVFIIMIFIFSLLSWPMLAREIRGKILAYREQDFITAIKEMGGSDLRIIFKHLLPNCLSHIIVVLTISIPQFILMESTLSFLGLGIQPPLISWGLLVQGAQKLETLGQHPWIIIPCIFIVFSVLGFNFLGDGLRDAADPYSSRKV